MQKPVKRLTVILFMALLAGTAGCGRQDREPPPSNGAAEQAPPAQQTEEEPVKVKQYEAPPPMAIDPEKHYSAVVKTSKGEFKIELLPAEAPKTVNNFVFLARDGFYDGVKFHRIIRDFMVQTGDPLGTGAGGPGYEFEDELPPKRHYTAGIVAMANAGPNTNGSQFFICTGKNCGGLDASPDYTVFGRVSEGMDVVQKIAATPVGPDAFGREMSVPKEDVRILSVTIEER